jgi:hypothetical protein
MPARCCLAVLLAAAMAASGSRAAAAEKLTFDQRVEIVRGLMAEYAVVKAFLPRSKKPLPYSSDGTWDKAKWKEIGKSLGPAARVGDQIQITHVTIDDNQLVLEINNGMKGKRWFDRVEVGMGNSTTPINQNSNAPSGTTVALQFAKGGVPALPASEFKKMLAPILDFDKHSATEQYVETLPPPVAAAIKENRVIEGMTRDQVVLSVGRPRHKTRETKDGVELEDWIFGQPPGKLTFVTFQGDKVIKVHDTYAGLGGSTAPPLPVK